MNLRGLWAEHQASRYLESQGLDLIARNYSCRLGEIDLVMSDHDTLVFVEVRQRSSTRFGGAAASITLNKQQKIQRAAEHFLMKHHHLSDMFCRFDVIAIQGGSISWLRDAFEC